MSFNTQPPEGGWGGNDSGQQAQAVSTHSRPKAAGRLYRRDAARFGCFNTQPPEGGWASSVDNPALILSFNTQPPEGGWTTKVEHWGDIEVSTHSRPKAAGASLKSLAPSGFVAPISLSSQEKREREYNTAFSVIPAFAIS